MREEPDIGWLALFAGDPATSAVSLISKAIEYTDDHGSINLSDVGNRILATAPDFDPRT